MILIGLLFYLYILRLKPYLKYIIYKFRLAGWLDILLYRISELHNRKANQVYKQQYPQTVLPADYAFYETYQLIYQKFIEDGELAAREITEWTNPYINSQNPCLLDWGCGAGRIIRHLSALQPHTILYGCDVNEEIIDWNKSNYPNICFTAIHGFPPMLYAPSFFNLVYGISVFTHIEAGQQVNWLIELHRILQTNGILLITTHGPYYYKKLLPVEKKILMEKGLYTQTYFKQGHRMMSTYHQPTHFKKMIEPYFTILEYYDGTVHPNKTGGQDLWILQKKS